MTQPMLFVLIIQSHVPPHETTREVVCAFDAAHAKMRFELIYGRHTYFTRDHFSGAPTGEPQPRYTLTDIEPFEYHKHHNAIFRDERDKP